MSTLPNGMRAGIRSADTDSLYDILALVLAETVKRGENVRVFEGGMPEIAGLTGRVVYIQETNSWQRYSTTL